MPLTTMKLPILEAPSCLAGERKPRQSPARVGRRRDENSHGFTLIEILVVLGLTIMLTMFGIAGYNKFNRTQVLKQQVLDFSVILRDAQNRALAGEVTASRCGASNFRLLEWRVVITSAIDYNLTVYCAGSSFVVNNYQLSTSLAFSPASGYVGFKPLGQGVSNGSRTTVTVNHTVSGKSIIITISTQGEITVGNII